MLNLYCFKFINIKRQRCLNELHSHKQDEIHDKAKIKSTIVKHKGGVI